MNDTTMYIRRYNQDGNIEYKGRAFWLTNSDEMRYCWDGKFVFYDKNRRKINKVIYKMGEEQDEE